MIALARALSAQVSPVSGPSAPGWTATRLIILAAIILAAFAVGGIVIYIVRSRILKGHASLPGASLTLHDVREMHRRGEIDEAEMARLKEIIIGRAKPAEAAPKPPAEEESSAQ